MMGNETGSKDLKEITLPNISGYAANILRTVGIFLRNGTNPNPQAIRS